MHLRTSPLRAAPEPKSQRQPWWRFPMVWLVLSGPLIVMVASFVTLGLALRDADTVEPERPQAPALHSARPAADDLTPSGH